MKLSKLAISVFSIILMWSLVVPIFEFPDEQAHFGTVSFLMKEGRVPSGSEKDMTIEMEQTQKLLGVFRNPLGQNNYTYHPEYRPVYTSTIDGLYENDIKNLNTSANRNTYVGEEAARYPALYYQIISIFTRAVNSQDIFLRIFVARLGGLAFVVAMTYVVFKLGLEIFSERILAYVLTILVFFQPMMSFVSAGVNSDNLHNLLFTLFILLSVKMLNRGLTTSLILITASISVLDILTKTQGYVTVPLFAFVLLLTAIKNKQWRILMTITILFLLLLYFTQNFWLGFLTSNNNRGVDFIEYLRFSSNKLLSQNVVWYWGVFKWLGVVLPPIYWRVANRLILISAVGIILYFFKVLRKKFVIANPLVIIFLCIVSITYTTAIFWYDWSYMKSVGFSLGIQARYFFPTIAAHLALLLTGIVSIGWNKRINFLLVSLLLLIFLWLQVGGLWRVITSYYDVQSLDALATQISQYKPFFAKGYWWILWVIAYISGITYLLKSALSLGIKNWVRLGQK